MNENRRVMIALQKLNLILAKTASKDLEKHGINESEFLILTHLIAKGSTKTQYLGEIAHISSGAITYFVNKMIAKNYVYKTQDQKDKRIFWIDITDTGQLLTERVLKEHDIYLAQLFEDVSLTEKNEFVSLIKSIGLKLENKVE